MTYLESYQTMKLDDRKNNSFWSCAPLAGLNYRGLLQEAHNFLNPRTYLEIGVNTGATLALSTCASVGIDPNFLISGSVVHNKPECHFFNTTSDRFFKERDVKAIFGCCVDMAFLDGLHLFEFLLRDFINTEKACENRSVIFMHDCIPTNTHLARRDMNDESHAENVATPAAWAGDVWKVVAILKKYRPELHILSFDAEPTGLVGITNLNPRSSVLDENYFDVIQKYRDVSLNDEGDAYINSLNVVSYKAPLGLLGMSLLFSA